MKEIYSKAYKEVLEILKYFPEKDVKKIPQKVIKTFETNADLDYKVNINEKTNFENIELLSETKALLVNLFRDYWATESQREKILVTQKYLEEELENEKKRKYNPDNLIKNINKQNYTKIQKNEVALVEYKESFFTRFKNFILKLFSRKS